MPGLTLTLPQAALLFGLTRDGCARVLGALVEERFLRRTETGRFMMATMSPAACGSRKGIVSGGR